MDRKVCLTAPNNGVNVTVRHSCLSGTRTAACKARARLVPQVIASVRRTTYDASRESSTQMVTIALALLFATNTPSQTPGAHNSKCWDGATTQLAMNECAKLDVDAANQKMNTIYQDLLRSHDSIFNSALRRAQRMWLRFRDAHIESIYPDREHRFYGSASQMCVSQLLAQMTLERTRQLRAFIDSREDDTCTPPGPKGDDHP